MSNLLFGFSSRCLLHVHPRCWAIPGDGVIVIKPVPTDTPLEKVVKDLWGNEALLLLAATLEVKKLMVSSVDKTMEQLEPHTLLVGM